VNHNFGIKTDKIELRPMTLEESLHYMHVRQRQENAERFFTQNKITDEMQTKWYENYLKDETSLMFSAYYEDKWVGVNSIYNIKNPIGTVNNTGEYGRLLVDKTVFPGMKGLGTALTAAAAQIAKEQLNFDHIYTEIYKDNPGSLTCNERVGYKRVSEFDDPNGKTIVLLELWF